MVEIAHQERSAAPACPAPFSERDDALPGEAPEVLLGAEHGAPQRMLAEGRPIDQVLGDHRWLVEGAVDLLNHDAPLPVELLGIDAWPANEVRQQVDRSGGALGAHGDVEGDQVVARVGVQDSTQPLGRLVDVAVVGVLLASLEDQVLEEVSHPVLLGRLVAGAGVERHQHGEGAGAGHLDGVHGQFVGRDDACCDGCHWH